MLNALFTAVSGMDASSTDLSVIGNNIANMNTVGFKSSDASFGDVLSQTLASAGGSSQVGLGVNVMAVTPDFSQGSFETTTDGLDMAINGNGMFMVNQGNSTYYTRDGEFSLNNNGDIVNPDGLVLQGYLADAEGNITSTLGNLQIAATQSPPNPTTTVDMAVNLDAGATPPTKAFTLDGTGTGVPNDPANYNFSNTTTIYDSQGNAQQITSYFVNTGPNAWTVHYVQQDPANPGQYIDAGTQNLTFNQNGTLANDNEAPINFNFGAGVAASAVTFNYGVGTSTASTQYSGGSSVTSVNQNGYASGTLESVNIASNGIISGSFSNGQTRTVGQVALAGFVAPTSLTADPNNLYSASSASGAPTVNTPNSAGLGTVQSDSLELSNVDLAAQFTNMITAQRGFEANSKIITTSDQMLQDLVNMIQG